MTAPPDWIRGWNACLSAMSANKPDPTFDAATRRYGAASARFDALSKMLDAQLLLMANSCMTPVSLDDIRVTGDDLMGAAKDVLHAADIMVRVAGPHPGESPCGGRLPG